MSNKKKVAILKGTMVDAVDIFELHLHRDDLDNIHYQIVDAANEPKSVDLTYAGVKNDNGKTDHGESEAFSEWKTIKKTISSKEINAEVSTLRDRCKLTIAKAKDPQLELADCEDNPEAKE